MRTLPLLLALLAPVAATAAPDPFAGCHAEIAVAPQARLPWRCVYMAARRDGVYDEAIAFVRAALAEGESAGASLALGGLLSDQGHAEAAEHFERAADAFAAQGEVEGEVFARLNLATFHAHAASLDDAEAQLERAMAAARAAGDEGLLRSVQIQQGRLRWWGGRGLGESWRTLRAIEADHFDTLAYQDRLLLVHVLARLSDAIERRRDALAWQRRVVALAEAEGDRYVEAVARLEVARMALAESDGVEVLPAEEIEAYVHETRRLAESAGNPYAVAAITCVLGQLADGAEREALYRSCVTAMRRMAYTAPAIDALSQWALELPVDRVDESLALLDEAASVVEEDSDFTYANLRWHRAIVLGRAGRSADALREAIEALDRIDASLHGQAQDLGKAGHLAHWAGLYHEVAALHLEAGTDEAAWRALELLRARVLVDHLGAVGAVEQGASLIAAGPPDTSTLAALRTQLADDEALIAYQVPPRGSASRAGFVWAISREGVVRAPLPDVATLGARVELYEGLVHEGAPDEARAARALYDVVLGPVLEGLPERVRHLVIVADGPLHRLPIDALVRGDGARVFERFHTTYAPSATVWSALRAQPPRLGRDAVDAVGDPVTAPRDPITGMALPSLPGARREALAAARRLGGRALVGADATEESLASSRARILHVAAHAVIDPTFPDESAIHLAPGPDSDGRLEAREILGLDLSGGVVVLSACRSADGPIVGGEGPMGLARALFQAGANTVVGTRWPLPDDAAAAFFDAFYAELATGVSVSEAVATVRAQRRALGDSPEVWAGVVVLGDGRATPVPAPESPWWPLGAGLAAVLGAVGGWRWWARAKV